MTDNIIKLKEDRTLRLKVYTSDGKDTGEELVFDLEDIELPLKYQQMMEEDKKNKQNVRNQILIIDRRQDVKGKKMMSKNEEDKIKLINEFFKKEIEVYNMFLGENGVQKLLYGRKVGWTTLAEIDEIIEEQIYPKIKVNWKSITERVKEMYAQSKDKKEEVEVLE